ncbi:hypothetical protein EW146_g1781 [Bondarzewia mesenterica]|uniref:Methyltransferase domain-containing protein n=1 Tax=Bondarzewia mesenterica TaxID=1095465 RepID=A0A4V3XFZ0_9AGAM|nr:hypothetical protein EW146_g1781 [Bondarzewia mesenterica]
MPSITVVPLTPGLMSLTDYKSDDESDALSDFSLSVASSVTSYDASMRSASPAPSNYSVTSSIRAQSYRHEYGRGLNNYSEVYRLPADDEEFERLDKQHHMFKFIMGKYPPPLPEVLKDDIPGETKACLDLGCGSGSWILECARDFPHCQAVAVDLVPMQATNIPPNCRSEVDDINLGMQHFYGDFNVVHARLISSGIRDYHGLIEQVVQVLRPGGLVDFLEFDFRCYDENHRPIFSKPGVMEGPWLPRWMSLLNMAVRQRGGSPDASNMLYAWFMQNPAYEDIVYREIWLPTAAIYPPGHPDYWIGKVMGEDIQAFLKSGRPLLLGSGLQESLVDELQQRAHTEVEEARIVTFCRVESVYARKRVQL